MPYEQDILQKMFNDKMSSKRQFSGYSDLETIRQHYLNQPITTATKEVLTIIQDVRKTLAYQKQIFLSEEVIWKCYLEMTLKVNKESIDFQKLGGTIMSTWDCFEWGKPIKPKPKFKNKLEEELFIFEEMCLDLKNPKLKPFFYELSKKYQGSENLVKLNNIKNKYW
jgi:hypothetical protein